MTNPFQTKHFDRFNDRIRSTVLTSMGRRTQALESSDAEGFLEIAR